MQIRSKAIRYLLWGITIDLIIVLGIVLFLVVSAVLTYDGKCPQIIMLDSGYTSCSLAHYVEFNLMLALLMLLLFWWLVIPALLVPPLVGVALGLYKSRTDPQSLWPVNKGLS